MRGIIFILFFVFISASFLIGGTLYESDLDNGELRDIYNLTEQINPNFSCSYLEDNSVQEITSIKIGRLNKIACKLADTTLVIFTEVVKYGVEFGYEHPQYDYEFYFKVVRLWIIALIISFIVPIVVPLMALIYLLFLGLKKIYLRFNS